jgi:hypothetical protein
VHSFEYEYICSTPYFKPTFYIFTATPLNPLFGTRIQRNTSLLATACHP